MAALQLSSRFGILNVMDASPDFDDSEEEEADMALGSGKQKKNQQEKQNNKDGKASRPGNAGGSSGTEGSMSANAKRRAKRKKNKQAAELRDIAFNPSVPKGAVVGSPPTSPPARLPPGLVLPEVTPASQPAQSSPLQHLIRSSVQWEEWKRKDRGVVKDQFEDDLQKAILASKIEYERLQQFIQEVGEAVTEDVPSSPLGVSRKERRKHSQGKDKPHPMSLQDFQATQLSSNGGLDEIQIPKKPEPDPQFFKRVEKDTAEIITKEERETLRKKNQKLAAENVRRIQFEDNLEKRDQEIEEMKSAMEKMKEELTQVKKRNKQLCFMLAQGEMKDKAEVLKQVDELSAVKDELTAEVAELHAALEQERSKVSSLKAEIQRLQEKKK
ncbi:G kinase-anchoring protein 1-like [Acanthaster planci]|uniref:G kinase-anchoring protein 1-like n=1 Tax=Acanthaster planci TaxID=133434 RepID=A0A8B7YVL7_ACAPL|nr:G kinase-anchoring protein 1-like [Acanthaster planci]